MTIESRRQNASAGTEAFVRAEPTRPASTVEEPQEPAEVSPIGLQVADSLAEAADHTGAVKATRRTLEPDSLGG